jgi:hypothetical protein
MHELPAAFVQFPLLLENPVHGAGRTKILAFVQQSGLDGGRSSILEAFCMQDTEDAGALIGA